MPSFKMSDSFPSWFKSAVPTPDSPLPKLSVISLIFRVIFLSKAIKDSPVSVGSFSMSFNSPMKEAV